MANKLQSDSELQRLVSAFFSVAPSARCRTSQELGEAYSAQQLEQGFNGAQFNAQPELRRLLNRITRRSVRLLGAESIHEHDVRGMAWAYAADVADSNVETQVKAFLEAVAKASTRAHVVLAPNDLIRFGDGVREVTIGPVRARMTEDIASEIKSPKKFPWKLIVSDDPGLIDFDEERRRFLVGMSDICWQVNVASSRKNVRQQALWLINVAVTLLRLSYPQPYQQRFFPLPPSRENHPTERHSRHGDSIVLFTGAFEGYYEVPKSTEFYIYGVTNPVLQHHKEIGFADRAAAIFSPPSKSVAERVSRGLGWLSRGRQSSDIAERFLFFFTATEALLSSDDKSAPVVQTIARHAATMISDDPEKRAEMAKTIRNLYQARSALVHAGSRNVAFSSTKDIQVIVENLYWPVLQKVDLKSSLQKFHGSLAWASYGGPWHPDKMETAEDS